MTHRDHIACWFSLALGVGWCGQVVVTTAAPLNLSDVPIFLAFQVEHNVVLVVDDSGSMDWEVLTKDLLHDGLYTGTQPDGTSPPGSGSVKHRDSDDDGVPDCDFGASGGQTAFGYMYGVEFATNTYPDDARDCHTADDEEWRFRNSDFNPLYFDPKKTYTPWAGVDAAGRPYQDMDIHAAKDNPYDPHSSTIDLTRDSSNWVEGAKTRARSDRDRDGIPDGFRYYTWSDVNNNGLFDDGEHTAHLIKDAPLPVQQNFANWFSYYRKREYVAKAVYSHVIANAVGVRMGLVTLNRNKHAINPAVSAVDTPLRSMQVSPATGNKHALLGALFSMHGGGGTPLRSTLQRVGQYLEGVHGRALFPTAEAYLPEAQGGACQQSFAVVMTDGLDNGPAPGVGNADGDSSTTFDGGPYADNVSNTLADVAMHFYERDVRPSLPDLLAPNPADPARHQHMVTYTVTLSGVSGTLTQDPSPATNGRAFWTDPVANDQFKLDDLRHAAFNGRGLSLQASDVSSLTEVLRRALNSIAQRTSAVASVALNTGVRSTGSRLYQARFDSADWSGQLLSVPIDPRTGEISQNPADSLDSGALLDTRLQNNGYNTNVRTILTWKPSTGRGIPFQWDPLDATQQRQLNTDMQGLVDGYGQARVRYLRGDNVDEVPAPQGRGFRARRHRLGDIVHSTPFFVDTPQLSDAVDPRGGYTRFRQASAHRMKMLVVGGNDGMLHIFNANEPLTPSYPHGDPHAGHEVLAYVPNAVMRSLSALTSPTYRHRFYVDGAPTVADVLVTPPGQETGWYTVAVGGTRGGGQGYFALNITDPSQFSETTEKAQNIVLWEFTDTDDADLGFAFSQPSIVRMANGKWAAVFGNGYNNTVADEHASTTGHGVLFIVFLNGPNRGPWIEGEHYIKIDTGVGTVATPNGLATPAVIDVEGDLTADYIVAGDLEGNLWRFDVTSSNPHDWQRPASMTRLFTAVDANGIPQPLTSRPEAGAHPANLGGVMIYVGTGKYLEPSDNASRGTTQTFYGIWDRQGIPVTRAELLQQTFIAETTVTDVHNQGRAVRVTSNHAIDWQQQRGWFIDLPAPGERQVSDAVLRNDRIFFTTLIPHTQVCSVGGSGFLVALDVNGGVRPASTIFDVNRDKAFSQTDDLSGGHLVVNSLGSDIGIIGTPTIQASGGTDMLYTSGSTGGTEGSGSLSAGAVGRQAWRQVTQ